MEATTRQRPAGGDATKAVGASFTEAGNSDLPIYPILKVFLYQKRIAGATSTGERRRRRRDKAVGATFTKASNSDLPIYPDLGSLFVPKTYGGGNLHRGEKTEATRQKLAGATRQRLVGQPPRRLLTRICQSIPILKVFLFQKRR